MRILFIIPSNPSRKIDSPDGMPLGVLYLASMIRNEHEVKIIDDYSFPGTIDIFKTIGDFDPDLIAISIPFRMLENSSRELIKKIRAISNARIVIGGIHATLASERISETFDYDFLILGESEILFRDLLSHIESDIDLASSGIIKKEDKFLKHTKRVPVDINSLPYPARDLLPNRAKYLERVVATRGCGFSCAFCSSRKFWGVFRAREVGSVIEELKQIYKDRGNVPISFADDSLTYDRNFAMNLAEAIINEPLSTSGLGFSSHPNRLDEELLDKMRKAGFDSIFIGLESGSDSVLKKIGKFYDRERTEELIKYAMSQGFDIHASFMIGLPFETSDDVNKTMQWVSEMPLKSVGFHLFYPFEGCPIRDNPQKYGIKIAETSVNEGDIDGEAVIHNGFMTQNEILDLYYRARALSKIKADSR